MEQGKGSAKRYILMAAVVAVWAVVIYKAVVAITSNGSITVDIPYVEKKVQEKGTDRKGYALLLSYPDPFLKESDGTPAAMEEQPAAPPTIVMWPSLKYSGYLKNEKGMVGVLELNGSYQSVRKGDVIEGVKVIEVYEDSIRLTYKDNLKTFLR
jgi:hypothetical protein